MALAELQNEIPTWAAAVLLAAVGLSVVYSIVIMGSLTALLPVWVAAGRAALSLFVVYLFYRFVLAVETIADKH